MKMIGESVLGVTLGLFDRFVLFDEIQLLWLCLITVHSSTLARHVICWVRSSTLVHKSVSWLILPVQIVLLKNLTPIYQDRNLSIEMIWKRSQKPSRSWIVLLFDSVARVILGLYCAVSMCFQNTGR